MTNGHKVIANHKPNPWIEDTQFYFMVKTENTFIWIVVMGLEGVNVTKRFPKIINDKDFQVHALVKETPK